jgi:thiosulfate/3-mercaptopyruvate sulfurtransferase
MFTQLISAQELSTLISDGSTNDLVILDSRHDLLDHQAGFKSYQQGHIPRAQFIDVETHLSGKKTSSDGRFLGRHPLPEREDFVRVARSFGIHNTTQVVVADAHGGMYAARVWWMLRWLGHATVAVLDGGMAAWHSQGLSLECDSTKPVENLGTLQARTSLVRQATLDEVLANISSQARVLVDARASDRFRGENETIDPVGGHIPGAKNRFFKDNLQGDGRFKSAAQLREEWLPIIADGTQGIMQCGSGVTACHNLLALEIAGLPGAALYSGSWSEWCADPSRPISKA